MLTAALGGLLFVAAASAGQSTVVRPNPLLSSAAVGESVVVTLYVQDVQNLYGADIGLSFDPAVLEVVDANPSVAGVQIQPLDTFLKPDFVVTAKACNVVDPADPDCAVAGRVRYVATQVNPSLPASGSGPLAAVTFKRLQVGDTPLIMDRAGLADRDGNAISAATQNGRVAMPAGQSTVVRPNPLLSSAAVGDSVVVTLYVQDVQDLYGADIGLAFDPAVLEVVDANASVAGVQIQPLDTFLKPDFVVTAKACNVVDPADPDCAVAGPRALRRHAGQPVSAGKRLGPVGGRNLQALAGWGHAAHHGPRRVGRSRWQRDLDCDAKWQGCHAGQPALVLSAAGNALAHLEAPSLVSDCPSPGYSVETGYGSAFTRPRSCCV